MDFRDHVHGAEPFDTIHDVMKAPVAALLGVNERAGEALAPLQVNTVFDLAVSPFFAAAAAAAGLGEAGRQVVSVGEAPAAMFNLDVTQGNVTDLGRLPLRSLRGISKKTEKALTQALGVTTLRDAAMWPPYRTAVELLRELLSPAASEPNGVPADLQPGSGVYPTERVFYERLLFDRELPPSSPEMPLLHDRGVSPIIAAITVGPHLAAHDTSDIVNSGPLRMTGTAEKGFTRPALGAVLRYSQSWYRQGLTLGQLLHAVALAPGEMTRIAVIDWSRRIHGSQSEAVSEEEALSNSMMHNRSIAEVTKAVARETQTGRSRTESGSTSLEAGAAVAGILPGPATIGAGAVGYATNETVAQGWSVTNGRRDVSAQMAQDVRDSTHQAANAARNRRASVIREVSQEESEEISTRVLVNYNHMHALTIQYYEVVQLYRVALRLESIDRCLFMPVGVLDFEDPAVIHEHRHALAAVALDPHVRSELLAGPNSIAITAPSLGDGGPAWDVHAAKSAGVRIRHNTGPRPSNTIHLPSSTKWDPVKVELVTTGETMLRWRIADLRTGQRYMYDPAYVGDAPLWPDRAGQPWTPDPVALDNVREIEIGAIVDNDDPPAQTRSEATFNLTFDVEGQQVTLPVRAIVGTGAPLRLRLHGGTAGSSEVRDHLQAHAVHYSQAVWRSLDSVRLASLLAPYRFGGRPVTDVIDPVPVAMAGNYLVFRMPTDPTADQGWAEWLEKHDIKVGQTHEDLVPLPSGGVHGEAVLGRANSAEKLDITRFWNWQDSPIPIQAPEIAPIAAGSRASEEDLKATGLSAPVVNIQTPSPLPDPQGMAAVLGAIQNGNMFRDMSGLAAIARLAEAALDASSEGASHAATQAGANLQTYVDLLKAAAAAATTIATGGAAAPIAGLATASPSQQGAVLNQGKDMDRASSHQSPQLDGSAPHMSRPNGASPNGSRPTWGHPSSNEAKAFDAMTGAPRTLSMPAPSPAAPVPAVLPQTGQAVGGMVQHASHPQITPPKPIEAVLRLFIPAPIVAPPNAPELVTMWNGGPIPVYGGDNRGFQRNGGTHRAEIRVVLTPDTTAATPILSTPKMHFGETTEYDRVDAGPVPGKPDWWWELKDEHGDPRRATVQPSPANIRVDYRRVVNPDIWWIDFFVSAALAATDPRIRHTAMAIDARLRLQLRTNPTSGAVEYHIYGKHDGFPAYEMYLGDKLVYAYDPLTHNASPLSLAYPEEITVNTTRGDLDVRTGFRALEEAATQSLPEGIHI